MPAAPPLRVLVHPDVLRLERELVDRIRALRAGPGGAFAPVLVLTASRRQMERTREVLAGAFPALLGVEVLTHQALAYRLAEADPARPAPALAPRALWDAVVEDLLAGPETAPGLSAYVDAHPGALHPVAGLLRELREAGVDAAGLRAAGPEGAEPAALLERFDAAVAALERDAGLTDRAGLARRAREAAAGLPPYRAVFQIGAYELVGMNLDLLRALPSETGITLLVPADPEAPAWRYAREVMARDLGAPPEPLEDGESGARGFVRAARLLRGRGGRPPEAPPEADIRLVHAQGPEAELNAAARRALRWIAGGVPPHEIAVTARTLDPYAPLAETVFARHRLPVESSATLPLGRHPQARAFLLLARALGRDFERQTVVDLLRSPYLVREEAEPGAGRRRPDAWDRWSRKHRVVGGERAWTEDLPRAVAGEAVPEWLRDDPEEVRAFEERRAEDAASAERLGALVAGWAEEARAWARCRTAAGHAAFLRGLYGRLLRGWKAVDTAEFVHAGGAGGSRPDAAGPDPGEVARTAEAVRSALHGALDDLEGLDALAALRAGGDPEPVTVDDALEFLESTVAEARLPWPSVAGGVRFLDVMQARGLAFRHVILLGFNTDLIPRRPREDLFLSDAARRRVRERTGRPLAVRLESREEEWLLFAGTVASAVETLTVSWQRADADGKARTVSLFLRELARALPGAPTLREVLEGRAGASADGAAGAGGARPAYGPERVPTHPAAAAAHLAATTGFLTREEGAVLAGAAARRASRGVAAYLEALDPGRAGALAAGLALAEAVERFETPDLEPARALAYDAFLPGGSGFDRLFSASSLEMLGMCPQKFYFRYVLGVKPLEEAVEEFRFEARELGGLMHLILERVAGDLEAAGLLDGSARPEALAAAGRESLDRHWSGVLDPVARRVGPHFPVLWRSAESAWRAEMTAFLDADLRRLGEAGHRLVGKETTWEGSVPLDGEAARAVFPEAALPLRGIPDRVTAGPEGTWLVSDYKTSGNLEKRLEAKEILTGHRLQLPLYMMLAAEQGAPAVTAEFLGLGPEFAPDGGFARTGPVALEEDALEGLREGLTETLAVLVKLVRTGRFPFSPGRHCDWCRFDDACRRHHYASAERVAGHPEHADYAGVQEKSKRKPLLAQVRGGDGDGEAGA